MDVQQYKEILSDIIKKQIALLGLLVAVNIAKKTIGISVLQDGTVSNIAGDPKQAMSNLVTSYLMLSGQISQNIVGGIMESHTVTGNAQ